MDTGLLWFFLFLALAIGWGLGFYSRPKTKAEEELFQNNNIKHRLQLFFDSYDDEAIDHFVQSLEVTPETLGLHISIGKHFRTQGEVEKAILIHQNLMAHPELDRRLSDPVVYELAKDYKAAGLFDRAEALLEQLKSSKDFSYKSRMLLLDIYEREKDWQEALDVACEIDLKRHPDVALRAAYHSCEIAEDKSALGELRLARQHLKKALSLSKSCVKAHIELAKLDIDQDNFGAAITHLKQVAENSPENISLTLPLLLECTRATSSYIQHRDYLKRLYRSTGQVVVMLAIVDSLIAENKQSEALEMLEEGLSKAQSLEVLSELLDKKNSLEEGLSPGLLGVIKDVVHKAQLSKSLFHCVQCGFSGNQMYWMCPSCKSWQSVHPAVEYIKQD